MEHKIVMDTVGWSGGNTSIEAIYLDKPIITLEGNTLRGNHTSAILKQINLEILIAKNYSEYLSLAKKINDDENFYNFVVEKIKTNKKFLFRKQISFFNKIEPYI